MPPPALMEELIEEILRFPPHDPALLVHAALVCKQWCRLVLGAGFQRRFREFHRTPPMLGFLYSSLSYCSKPKPKFVRIAASCPPIAHLSHCWMVIDARHGRVQLAEPEKNALVIWDPITDHQRRLPFPKQPSQSLVTWSAAVLCTAHGSCDHLDCHNSSRSSFLVVFACSCTSETIICTYSSDTATWSRWSDSIYTHQQSSGYVQPFMPRALVGNALYFGFYQRGRIMILKYELESHEQSAIDLPPLLENGTMVPAR
ncbi:uncharacterized protein LOC120677954 [Panicum virgatum]|uniref:uncharacterized protein LOC120677954 n=1 Tax=Panicum virgatum TaxID=38727 RepID=UPI0019D4F942|nr:uncharacterized protein LOC120677954 [Panicum virgatum]